MSKQAVRYFRKNKKPSHLVDYNLNKYGSIFTWKYPKNVLQSLTLQLPFLKYLFLSFSDSEEESRSTLLETQYGIVIILQNRKIPTDFYLVSIWQLILLKGYIQTYQTTKVLLLSKTRQLHKENHSHKIDNNVFIPCFSTK